MACVGVGKWQDAALLSGLGLRGGPGGKARWGGDRPNSVGGVAEAGWKRCRSSLMEPERL